MLSITPQTWRRIHRTMVSRRCQWHEQAMLSADESILSSTSGTFEPIPSSNRPRAPRLVGWQGDDKGRRDGVADTCCATRARPLRWRLSGVAQGGGELPYEFDVVCLGGGVAGDA